MQRIWLLLPIILLTLLGACRFQVGPVAPATTPTPSPLLPASTAGASVPAPAPDPTTTTHLVPEPTPSATPTWAAPQPLSSPFALSPLTTAEIETAQELAAASPPLRDDIALAQAFRKVATVSVEPATNVPPAAGDTASFTVLNIDSNTYSTIEAALLGNGEFAYFWFDTAEPVPAAGELSPLATAFDAIYTDVVASFGPEDNPGIDGDPRLHILHASPAALCDNAASCSLLGYFSSSDSLPRSVVDHSNERDMFIMNRQTFATESYLNVLAHELRHMIEDNYDKADTDWEVEGSAMLAEELAGFTANASSRANAFLAQPDLQLNSWTNGRTTPYYGMAYLINRYLYDRLGPDLYRDFASHPADGLAAVTAVAAGAGLPLTGQSLWEDWQVALALHNHPEAAEQYRLGDGSLDIAAATSITTLPAVFTTTVSQYAGDYYQLEGDGEVTITFTGAQRVPLLDVSAASGAVYWYPQRANFSQPSLTRYVDLSDVASATLSYDVYHEIETGYDFAYLAVSSDGGRNWEGLAGNQMQGLEPADDPAGRALTPRFYTGESGGWVREEIDLTPYAGGEIMLRFIYVTDPILTFGGLALDNIRIPEVGLYDDVEENDSEWQAEGFSRVTATTPQMWHLQLITFVGGVPAVTPLPVSEEGGVATTLSLGESEMSPILVVSASAPLTLQPAHYTLAVTR